MQPNTTLQMRHPVTGENLLVSMGYAWSVLLLGPIELVRRRDWPLAAVSVLLPILGQILLAPWANRAYLKRLLRRGFRAVSTEPGHVSRIEWQLGMQLPRYTGRSSKSAEGSA
ncbi:hypothetical protein [Sphaerotilus sp.]|uniref:hypothetical protein n=1 Tax=Sphaerotilus sp. TaxID=2093942 RepID=UPI00286E1D4D|nr:hypothetical protein [Sphaerotilus sp.]